MKGKTGFLIIGLFIGLAVGIIAATVAGRIRLTTPETVVRTPALPGEATLLYTPPAEPKIPAEMITRYLPMLRTMITPEVRKVTESVYVAMGYALGNVIMIVTDDGLVIVDATENEEAAREVLADFRKITDKPVKRLIYTHMHPDHTQGGAVFCGPETKVMATEAFLEWIEYQNSLLGEHHRRSRATQAGRIEPDFAFPVAIRSPFREMSNPTVVMPTVTFAGEHSFSLGDRLFTLIQTAGETEDHLALWIPDEGILMPGDLYYASFPNLSTPMLESRPVREWIDSLTLFIGLKPEIMVPQHTGPVEGAAEVKERLTNYRDAIRHVHDETVRCINEGHTVHEAIAQVRLPPRLAALPYLQERYGRIDWSVRGIYHGYRGWYDGLGTGLHPGPPEHRAREFVALAGGANNILARAVEIQRDGGHQLCAELCDIVIAANPEDRLAHRIKAASMHHLAFATANLNSFGFYRSASALHRKAAGAEPE